MSKLGFFLVTCVASLLILAGFQFNRANLVKVKSGSDQIISIRDGSGSENTCTAFQLKKRIIVTAAHCIDSTGMVFIKQGHNIETRLLSSSRFDDLALFYAPELDPDEGFDLTVDVPEINDNLSTVGFIGDLPTEDPVVLKNTYLGLTIFDGHIFAYVLGDHIWPGMSGGPILDTSGDVVCVTVGYRSFIYDSVSGIPSTTKEVGFCGIKIHIEYLDQTSLFRD